MFFFHKDPYFCIEHVGEVHDVYVTGKSFFIDVDQIIEYNKAEVKKNIDEQKIFFKIKRKIKFYLKKIIFK